MTNAHMNTTQNQSRNNAASRGAMFLNVPTSFRRFSCRAALAAVPSSIRLARARRRRPPPPPSRTGARRRFPFSRPWSHLLPSRFPNARCGSAPRVFPGRFNGSSFDALSFFQQNGSSRDAPASNVRDWFFDFRSNRYSVFKVLPSLRRLSKRFRSLLCQCEQIIDGASEKVRHFDSGLARDASNPLLPAPDGAFRYAYSTRKRLLRYSQSDTFRLDVVRHTTPFLTTRKPITFPIVTVFRAFASIKDEK